MRLLTIGAMQQQNNLIWRYKGEIWEYEEVTNPTTGRVWMDRNLGASQVATAFNDALAYGDLFQWGRLDDLHQNQNSDTTATKSNTDTPGHGDFITSGAFTDDWRVTPNNDLWQPPGLINVPAPSGFRLPTEAEWDAEVATWDSTANRRIDAYNSVLKLTTRGYRGNNGALGRVAERGYYWSSTTDGNVSVFLFFRDNAAQTTSAGFGRIVGQPVRLIKEL